MSAKTVFISGGATGIGAATARQFAQSGWRVAIGCHNQKPEAESGVTAIPLDLNDDESVRAAAAQVLKEFGSLEVLINNAGAFVKKPLPEQSFVDIHGQIAANLEGMIKLTREFLLGIKETVINVGSGLGFVGKAHLSVYAATKWGVRGFTKSLAKERPDLRVYTVNPGLTATQMGSPAGMRAEKVAEVIFAAATGRYGLASGADIDVRYYAASPLGKLKYWLKSLIR